MPSKFETVKVASTIAYPAAGGVSYHDIPIKPGKGQVALLLAAQMAFAPDTTGANNFTKGWIWRKSPPNVSVLFGLSTALWISDPDIIDFLPCYNEIITQGVAPRAAVSYKVYPYPVVLIRQPQFVVATFSGDTEVSCICWYMLQSVTDKEMTKLMVKDHA